MIVTLITDFGTVDGYAGEMKGVVLSVAPDADLVDVTHDVPPGDVRAGAWALFRVWARFPPGTVHLVVVDPGVGGDRRAVVARIDGRWFVGPDNGLLTRVLGRGEATGAWGLDPARAPSPVADTFHGRDLFAPAAARLARGDDPSDLGPAVPPDGLVRLEDPGPVRRGGRLEGRVVHVDRFGTLVTDVPAEWLPASPVAEVGGHAVDAVGSSFTAVPPGKPLLIRGSVGTLEIAVRDGSAAEWLGVGRGAAVVVRPGSDEEGRSG